MLLFAIPLAGGESSMQALSRVIKSLGMVQIVVLQTPRKLSLNCHEGWGL